MVKTKNSLALSALILLAAAGGYFLGILKNKSIENTAQQFSACQIANLHQSYLSTQSFFDAAYQNAPQDISPAKGVRGVIVNHHLLAPHLIAETMNTIATNDPITVVLVSPNHFAAGRGQIISSLYNWNTPYGVLSSDCAIITKLQKMGIVAVDESPFKNEHGVSGIVPFIKKTLPNAKVIPVIVKDTLSQNELNRFVDALYATLGNKAVIVGSFDFSHHAPDALTQVYDKKSISVIQNFDYPGIKTIETDSKPGLEIVLRYLAKESATRFHLIANTNSSQILHDPTIAEATSYIDGSFFIGDQ